MSRVAEVKVCRKGHRDRFPGGACRPCQKASTRRYEEKRGIYRGLYNGDKELCNRGHTLADGKLEDGRRRCVWCQWLTGLSFRYNQPPEFFDALWKRQEGRCKACGAGPKQTRWGPRLHLDHDHACCAGNKSCGKCIRGFLCPPCNGAMGLVCDSTERLLALVRYLDG